MNALADAEVGRYLNEHCVASYQKVGTFQVINGQKLGGNVAAYFCEPDGSVLHVVAGPVNAATLLREARWLIEARKLAQLDTKNDPQQLKTFFGKAHIERLRQEHGVILPEGTGPAAFAAMTFNGGFPQRGLGTQGRVHQLLAAYPLAKVEEIYKVVFENVLGEPVSTLPVVEANPLMPRRIKVGR